MHKHLFYYDLGICLQARQLASVSVNRKWRSLDEIVIFRPRDLDFQTQRAIIYQKLHRKWNFFLRIHFKKQSNLHFLEAALALGFGLINALYSLNPPPSTAPTHPLPHTLQ